MNGMSRRFRAAVVVAVITASGCPRNGTTTPVGPASLSLRSGEAGDADGIGIMMIDVENDSRCPSDVQCVSAGNAVVAFTLRLPGMPPGSGTAAKQVLNTTVEPRSMDVPGYRIRLDSLTPYPVSTHVIAQDEYTAFFTVTTLPN